MCKKRFEKVRVRWSLEDSETGKKVEFVQVERLCKMRGQKDTMPSNPAVCSSSRRGSRGESSSGWVIKLSYREGKRGKGEVEVIKSCVWQKKRRLSLGLG